MPKEHCPDEPKNKPETGSTAGDQVKRRYYYDDAYGYEDYDPETEERPDRQDSDAAPEEESD
jgi:hypothetical protein